MSADDKDPLLAALNADEQPQSQQQQQQPQASTTPTPSQSVDPERERALSKFKDKLLEKLSRISLES